ncbi:MAG: hypothetical protein R2788_03485 [Saprospiraceae bacterium]
MIKPNHTTVSEEGKTQPLSTATYPIVPVVQPKKKKKCCKKNTEREKGAEMSET